MDGSVLEGVDAMITRFELNWNESMGPNEIASYLTSWPPNIAQAGCLELLFSDIDRRMRRRSEVMDAQTNVDESSLEFTFPFDVDFYRQRLLQTEEDRESLSLYLQCMRVNLGDCPAISEEESSRIQSEFNLERPRLTVFEKSSVAFSAEFSGRLLIGRQELSDPEPYSMVKDKDIGEKLVFSPVSDPGVSRRQAILQFRSRNLVSISNASRNRAFGIMENGPKKQNIVLSPGESVAVRLPAMLVLGEKIQIDRGE